MAILTILSPLPDEPNKAQMKLLDKKRFREESNEMTKHLHLSL